MTAREVQSILRIQDCIQEYRITGLHEYQNYKNYMHIWEKQVLFWKFHFAIFKAFKYHSANIWQISFCNFHFAISNFKKNYFIHSSGTFRSILTNFVPFRYVQIRSDPFKSIQISSDPFRSVQIHSDQICPVLICFICFDPLWFILILYDPFWSFMIHFDPLRSILI